MLHKYLKKRAYLEITRSCDRKIEFSNINRNPDYLLGNDTSPTDVTFLVGDGSCYDNMIPKW